MFHHRSSLGPVELAFTDRHGGVGAAPRDSLDLSLDMSQHPHGERAENLRRVLTAFDPGAPPAHADLEQVHGREVAVVRAGGPRRARADAQVTAEPGLTLVVRAADCVPVLLADPAAGVIGAVHSGRQGVVVGVVHAAVDRMRDLGARHLTAWVGPHVCGGCYEVPPELQDAVASVEPATRSTTTWGTPALDLGAGVRAQLEHAGATVLDVSACTRESPDLFSFRRDGAEAGRLAGLVRLGSGVRR